jgi:hypothetical protein
MSEHVGTSLEDVAAGCLSHARYTINARVARQTIARECLDQIGGGNWLRKNCKTVRSQALGLGLVWMHWK